MLHKSDAGGVVVGIADAGGAGRRRSPTCRGGWTRPEFSVERMAPLDDGVELIVGARRDPRFGPVALVGLGGIYAELFGDVAIGLAPLDVARGGAAAALAARRGAAGRRPRPGGGATFARRPGPRPRCRGWRRRAPGHRRDRDQPAAGDAGRRRSPWTRASSRREGDAMLVDGMLRRAGRGGDRRRQRHGPGDGAGVRAAGRGGGGGRPAAGAAGRDGGADRGRRRPRARRSRPTCAIPTRSTRWWPPPSSGSGGSTCWSTTPPATSWSRARSCRRTAGGRWSRSCSTAASCAPGPPAGG